MMLQTNQVFNICIILLCFAVLSASIKQNDHQCTEVVSWHLRKFSSTFNVTKVLRKGSGVSRIAYTENVNDVVVNVTTSVVTCCKDYETNHKGKCRKCRKGTFGEKCSQICQCDGCKRYNHVTGECKKCLDKTCEETSPSTTECRKGTFGDKCSKICHCGGVKKCKHVTGKCKKCLDETCEETSPNTTDNDNENKDKDDTILIAVILFLVISTIILVVCMIARERYHRLQKRRKKRAGQLPNKADVCEYVDPGPVYSEIREEDTICRNGNVRPQNNISYAQKIDNECQTSVHQYNIDNPKESTEYEGCGYLNPYIPLRFARSETNLFRDKKVRKNGEYDFIYSLSKPSEEIKLQEERTADVKKENEKCNSSQKEEECLSDVPTYFTLAKVENETESHEAEREKLLSRKSRSSI